MIGETRRAVVAIRLQSGMPCCETVRPENAARRFTHPAPLLAKPRVKQLLIEHAGSKVIEIGAGCLRNAVFLQSMGFAVSVLEVPEIEERFPDEYARFRAAGGEVHFKPPRGGRFAFALSTFVIETICIPARRREVLRATAEMLKPRGFLLLSVRGPADLVTARAKGVACADGFLTPNRTFARAFTRSQLTALLKLTGFHEVEFLHKKATGAPELLHAIAWKRHV
jgi:hypothetical protein